MNLKIKILILVAASFTMSSCVTKKKYSLLKTQIEANNKDLANCNKTLSEQLQQLESCDAEKKAMQIELSNAQNTLNLRKEQIVDLKEQLIDLKNQRDKSSTQVGDLTALSQSATDNIKETLTQLEKKDKYIHLLQAAKTRTDSVNLALAVNLKGELKDGIDDQDIDIKVDKSVVFINLSDKMLFKSGSSNLTPKAGDVLGKIAKIINAHPELEVMVEGYTDNVPIKNNCMEDNWDLSVKRSTSVVRVLQAKYAIDPNRLIAAGRGEYNTLTTNDNANGRAINRRTRIIILPKIDQFYDLLNPNNVPK